MLIYLTGRALAAPVVRRMFSSSPKDPRYHMLSHISVKFTQPLTAQLHEPRAALFLNRFTRTLSIMYATDCIEEIIGIPANIMCGRSFYHCIAENCLPDAVKCLESAKGNDSIAYLRFWFRDPRTDDSAPEPESVSDESIATDTSDGMEEGCLKLRSHGEMLHSDGLEFAEFATSMNTDSHGVSKDPRSGSSSGDSGSDEDTHEAIFGKAREARSSASSIAISPGTQSPTPSRPANNPVELEAVVSCTSDGLVVCLRKARSMIPHSANYPAKPMYDKGLFTAPWAREPMLSPLYRRQVPGFATGFAPSQGLMATQHNSSSPLHTTAFGPDPSESMGAIRDQAIFAWALTGINGALGSVAEGEPHDPSTPKDGYAVWANDTLEYSPVDERSMQGNGMYPGQERRMASKMFGDPGLGRNDRVGGNRVKKSA